MTDLHAAVVGTAGVGWAMRTADLARRQIPRSGLIAYVSVVRDRDSRVDRHNWWVTSNGQMVIADACTTPADAIAAADNAALALLRSAAARKAAAR